MFSQKFFRDFFGIRSAEPAPAIPSSLRRPRYSRENTCKTCIWYRESPESNGAGGRCMFHPPLPYIIDMPVKAPAVAVPGHRANGSGGQVIMHKQSIGALPTVAAGDYCAKHLPEPARLAAPARGDYAGPYRADGGGGTGPDPRPPMV
jgi:hypothetical protein